MAIICREMGDLKFHIHKH